jgi:hypothetical protein
VAYPPGRVVIATGSGRRREAAAAQTLSWRHQRQPPRPRYQDERLEESSRPRQAASTRQSVDRPRVEATYPLASRVVAVCLGTISRLDHVRLQADGARPAVQLEKEPASVAEDEAIFIAAPKWRGARRAILANGL